MRLTIHIGVKRTLTSKKGLFYYTKTGKTEEAIQFDVLKGMDIIKLNKHKQEDINFNLYETIIIGTPTYGRGIPPLYFRPLVPQLISLEGKKIGLFGSGQTIYGDDYCGALDLLQEITEEKNEILFKYKFEGMPRKQDINIITKLILEA